MAEGGAIGDYDVSQTGQARSGLFLECRTGVPAAGLDGGGQIENPSERRKSS
jgi:hypothetical protein